MPQFKAINAVMIYADRPEELARWYQEHLGIKSTLNPADSRYYGELGAWRDGSPVHFGIFPAPKPLGDAPRSVMINYRVDDLAAAKKQLQAKGVIIENTIDESYGDFAYIRDSEGNPIELWMQKKPFENDK